MTALKGLEEKLEEGVAFLGKPPAPLLLALAHLSSSTSGNIISGVRGAVLKWLLPAICGLIGSPLEDATALLGILRILQEALADSAGKIPGLRGYTEFTSLSAIVRLAANIFGAPGSQDLLYRLQLP